MALGALTIWAFASDLQIGLGTKSLANNFSVVHFNSAGNDFGGGAFRVSTQKKLENPMIIHGPMGDSVSCSSQIQGYYYNSQRGERLRPLDEVSLASLKSMDTTYDDLSLQGGLYTNCSGQPYNIYGNVIHKINAQDQSFELTAGLAYNSQNNKIISDASLTCSLQLINNQSVIGYLYDKSGGIGFVGGNLPNDQVNQLLITALQQGKCVSDFCSLEGNGGIKCQVDNHKRTIQNDRSFQNLKWSIAVRGVVGLTRDILDGDRVNIEGNFGSKTQTVTSDAISMANAINQAANQAAQLCRNNRVQYPADFKTSSEILCYNGGSDLAINPSSFAGKTLVVKKSNVVLSKYMQASDRPFSLFIDGGNLILPSNVKTSSLLGFDDGGYPTSSLQAVNYGNYLKGTIIVNGLVLGKEHLSATSYTGILNKLYVHGKLMTFNTYDNPSETRINLVSSVLGVASDYLAYINFRDLFLWRCQDNGE